LAKNLTFTQSVTIAASGTTSSSVTIDSGRTVLAIRTPASLDGTAFTFQASDDEGNNFYALYNGGTQYSVNVGTSRYVALSPDVMLGVRYFRIVSGSTETAARSIKVISGDV
jgi:hypothetical protein